MRGKEPFRERRQIEDAACPRCAEGHFHVANLDGDLVYVRDNGCPGFRILRFLELNASKVNGNIETTNLNSEQPA